MTYFNTGFSFLLDPLSIFFLIVIFVVSIPSAIYSVGYLRGDGEHRVPASKKRLAWGLLVLFVSSMAAVVTASNTIAFLIAWEMMSLVSYFLVVFDSTHERAVQAGTIYIVMTHAGTAFLVAAFFMMHSYAHSFDFAVIREAARYIPAPERDRIFVFLLIGFGTKAGIVPLHIWLPYAHPQAPSHISSIMSGVMIKTAVYGLIRFVICILGVQSAWWGNALLAAAVLSCLTGVIYALMEQDIKKLLAYSSIENIGIILMGVGLSLVFAARSSPYIAALALTAGLYHLLNHAVFKGALFLSAGSVYKAAGTRNIEKLGGLIKVMPATALCFLLGAMAVSALPPLNGFVGEWLTLQAFFLGSLGAAGGMKIFLGICAALLALTGGLSAACFVKAFGITFLARPRSRFAQGAKEGPFSMKLGMGILSLLMVFLGLGAVPVTKAIFSVAANVLGVSTAGMSVSLNAVTLQPGTAPFSPVWIAFILAAAALFGVVLYRYRRPAGSVRVFKTWDCGYYRLDARNEYTGTAFSKPFRIAFSFFLRPYRRTQKIRESFYHVKSFSYETHTTMIFKQYLYLPLVAFIFKSAKSLRRIQPGSIHPYLGYIFATAVVLILFMKKF